MKHVSFFVLEALHTLVRSSESGKQTRVSTKNLVFSALILLLYVARIVNDLL